jgi:hypothetical protein
MPLPIGVLCSRRAGSNCAVTHPTATTHRVAKPGVPAANLLWFLFCIFCESYVSLSFSIPSGKITDSNKIKWLFCSGIFAFRVTRLHFPSVSASCGFRATSSSKRDKYYCEDGYSFHIWWAPLWLHFILWSCKQQKCKLRDGQRPIT